MHVRVLRHFLRNIHIQIYFYDTIKVKESERTNIRARSPNLLTGFQQIWCFLLGRRYIPINYRHWTFLFKCQTYKLCLGFTTRKQNCIKATGLLMSKTSFLWPQTAQLYHPSGDAATNQSRLLDGARFIFSFLLTGFGST